MVLRQAIDAPLAGLIDVEKENARLNKELAAIDKELSRVEGKLGNAGFLRDLYISLGEPVGEGAWAVRVHHKPFVRWLWLGGLLMGLGGALTLADRRYRTVRTRVRLPVAGAVAGA